MKEKLVNRYSLSKTLKFSLKPQGKTKENFYKLLEAEEQRAKNYEEIKDYIDRYHKHFIEKVLSELVLDEDTLEGYAELYNKSGDSDEMRKKEKKMREAIANALTKAEGYIKQGDRANFIKELEISPTFVYIQFVCHQYCTMKVVPCQWFFIVEHI